MEYPSIYSCEKEKNSKKHSERFHNQHLYTQNLGEIRVYKIEQAREL